MVLDADVCVVGSGAGGGVIAGTLAGEGKHVVVLEMGGYYNEADFNQLELWAYENLFLGGGLIATDDGSIALMAGSNLGGGTTVNWTNCIRTARRRARAVGARVRARGPGRPRLRRATSTPCGERLGVNDECSDYNGPHQRMQEACEALGYDFDAHHPQRRPRRPTTRTPPASSASATSPGSKQGTLKTYLQDAFEHGAQFVARCRVDRVAGRGRPRRRRRGHLHRPRRARTARVRRARAAGRRPRAVRWRRRRCCCARASAAPPWASTCACIPPAACVGVYDEPQKGWWGAPQTGAQPRVRRPRGRLRLPGRVLARRCPASAPATVPWHGGRVHKDWMAPAPTLGAVRVPHPRPRPPARVTIDGDGNAVGHYAMTDALDDRHYRRALGRARAHARGGGRASRSITLPPHGQPLGAGRGPRGVRAAPCTTAPLDPYELREVRAAPDGLGADGQRPATMSVADPWGELHDIAASGSATPAPSRPRRARTR